LSADSMVLKCMLYEMSEFVVRWNFTRRTEDGGLETLTFHPPEMDDETPDGPPPRIPPAPATWNVVRHPPTASSPPLEDEVVTPADEEMGMIPWESYYKPKLTRILQPILLSRLRLLPLPQERERWKPRWKCQ